MADRRWSRPGQLVDARLRIQVRARRFHVRQRTRAWCLLSAVARVIPSTDARYVRLVRFSFLILIDRFVTLDP
jgi:hypothetical protein